MNDHDGMSIISYQLLDKQFQPILLHKTLLCFYMHACYVMLC